MPQHNLTVYLLKPEFKEPEDAVPQAEALKKFVIKSETGASTVGDLFVRTPRAHTPTWASFFEGHVDPSELGRVASTAATMLVKAGGRLLALVFGTGRFLLAPDCWEERFGLKVVLNSVAPDKIRSMDKRTFDALSTQSRIQASRDGAAPDFGLDVEQDLVRAVTGTPTDEKSFGKRLSGKDALHCAVTIDVTEVKPLFRSLLAKSADETYKTRFPWIDHVSEVTSKMLTARLDEQLVEIVNGDRDRCWLSVPEIIDWAHTDGFKYGFGPRDALYQDLDFEGFFETVGDHAIDIESLHHRRAHQVDGEGGTVDSWQIYHCIYCECEHGGHTYLLTGGRWYRVDVDFVGQVNHFFDTLTRYGPALPEYNDDSEGHYCARVAAAAPEQYALMDRKTVAIGGAYGRIEFCDLFTIDKTLLHLKKYGASSVLSHLFSQGAVSGEAFRSDPSFRVGALEHLPEPFKLFSREVGPQPGEYQVVFGVISGRNEALKLPFFSRVNLRQACRRLEAYGYRPALAKIQIADARARLKKYPAR